MPFSEKKGRFTVSITEQPRPPSPTPSLSEAPPTGSPGSSGVNRAVKRGRFLVSCLPCSSSPCLAPTLSLQAEEVGLLSQDSLKVVDSACASRSTCSSDGTRGTTMDHSSAAPEVTSPCQDTCPATAAMAAAGQAGVPAQSPELRRVRFSETAEDLPGCSPAQQQEEASTAQAANKRHQQQQPEPPRQLKHTRSYCSGRFMIQEAVSVATAGLYRSTSAPEVAGSMSSSMSSCSSLQATYGPFAASMCGYGRSGSPDSSIDSTCVRPGNTAGSYADLAAANELMSSFMQQQHSSQQQHAVLGYPSQGAPCPAGHHAAAAAGLFAFASVPLPSTLGSASSEEEGSFISSLLSSSDIASDAGHHLLQGTPFAGGSSAASSSHSSGVAARRCASNSSSSANLLGTCCSGGAELMSAAAAAALGHHYQGPLAHAHSHLGHQHIAPKRSASMTYFRRGRFLVQTTMN